MPKEYRTIRGRELYRVVGSGEMENGIGYLIRTRQTTIEVEWDGVYRGYPPGSHVKRNLWK